jgi:L-amino acid N-acyltransferase YncA
MTIEPMAEGDWPAVAAIYQEGIDTGHATLEVRVPTWPEWDASHRRDGRLVAREDGHVVAWAALSPVSERCCYAGVAEVSLYVAASARGRGVGRALLRALVEVSERQGIWTLQAGILSSNEASLALCSGCGFRVVGRRERLGQLHGTWRDVILMERRSRVVGVA